MIGIFGTILWGVHAVSRNNPHELPFADQHQPKRLWRGFNVKGKVGLGATQLGGGKINTRRQEKLCSYSYCLAVDHGGPMIKVRQFQGFHF